MRINSRTLSFLLHFLLVRKFEEVKILHFLYIHKVDIWMEIQLFGWKYIWMEIPKPIKLNWWYFCNLLRSKWESFPSTKLWCKADDYFYRFHSQSLVRIVKMRMLSTRRICKHTIVNSQNTHLIIDYLTEHTSRSSCRSSVSIRSGSSHWTTVAG